VKQRVRAAAKRGAAPILAALDRRLGDLAVRLERHTSALAAEHGRRLDQIDDRVRLDLRVVDEHLLAIAKATGSNDSSPSTLLAPVGDSLVLIAPPGVLLEPIPAGMRIVEVSAFMADEHGTWRVVPGDERTDTMRVAQLAPNP
jgi:hypothetical protein